MLRSAPRITLQHRESDDVTQYCFITLALVLQCMQGLYPAQLGAVNSADPQHTSTEQS